eukprot:5076160-Pyramimonas_sp.AAC.1
MKAADASELTPPLLLDFHKKMMKDAARAARGQIVFGKPHSSLARLIVLKSISRAVVRLDYVLADKLFRSHPIVARLLEIDPIHKSVQLVRAS